MMLRKISLLTILFVAFAASAVSQDGPSPSPTPAPAEERMARLEEEIELLKKQKEYEKLKSDLSSQRLQELRGAAGDSSLRSREAKTQFEDDKEKNAESVSLSYDALKELSTRVGDAIGPHLARYSGVVIHHEPDFRWLAQYRLYRAESRAALRNYERVAGDVARIRSDAGSTSAVNTEGFSVKRMDPATMALSLPSIGTSYARSVAELLSVFSTETTISQQMNTVDGTSLGTAMANELKKNKADLRIFYPEAFVAEYDLETEGSDSLIAQISQINQAKANLDEFLARSGKLSEPIRSMQSVKESVALAESVKKQLAELAITNAGTESTSLRAERSSELRQLIRAEKLDRFLRAGSTTENSTVGIIKLRVLSSGGSRRETRNLFLGNKIRYSGSVVIEVLLFDADGTLRLSEIFSHHTGFRKMSVDEKR